jgi:DNA polymerase-4
MHSADPLCRDCLVAAPSRNSRCGACGSPRLLSHPERDSLSIAHIDCDAFYAAIEKRDDPSLADKPLIVGGGKRGVVSTCCYIARTYGVHSAMPMFKALAACPNAIVIHPDMQKYARVGREVRGLLFELTPLVEPLSIDEAFVDLTGTERLHRASAAETLARFARRVEQELGISVSIGLSYCKFLAKIASDFDKPRGFSVLGRAEARTFLADKPVRMIWGIGKVAENRLAKDGFRMIGDLQTRSEIEMMKLLGNEGRRLWRLANGIDDRSVNAERETQGISAETTFDADYSDAETLRPILFRLCEKVAKRLKAADLAGQSVTLKLKSNEFKLRTRSRSGLPATQLASLLFGNADALLKPELDGTRYRLIGIGAGDLVDAAGADRGDLTGDAGIARVKSREAAVDALRDKFGADAVVRGVALDRKLFSP